MKVKTRATIHLAQPKNLQEIILSVETARRSAAGRAVDRLSGVKDSDSLAVKARKLYGQEADAEIRRQQKAGAITNAQATAALDELRKTKRGRPIAKRDVSEAAVLKELQCSSKIQYALMMLWAVWVEVPERGTALLVDNSLCFYSAPAIADLLRWAQSRKEDSLKPDLVQWHIRTLGLVRPRRIVFRNVSGRKNEFATDLTKADSVVGVPKDAYAPPRRRRRNRK